MRRPGRGRGGILVVGEAPEVEAVVPIKRLVDSTRAMRTTIIRGGGGRWVDCLFCPPQMSSKRVWWLGCLVLELRYHFLLFLTFTSVLRSGAVGG